MKYFLIILIGLLPARCIQAQYFINTGDAIEILEKDTVVLSVDNSYSNFHWQASLDSIDWTDISLTIHELKICIDSTAAYRAISNEGNCPVISDTVIVGIQEPPVSNSFVP